MHTCQERAEGKGSKLQPFAGVPGWTRLSRVVTQDSWAEGTGDGGKKVRLATDLLDVSRSLILLPLRSSHGEKGLTSVRWSPRVGGDSGDRDKKSSDQLWESWGSGLGSMAE